MQYKQNDVFRADAKDFCNACVGKNGGPYGYDDYASGYFAAGKRIVEGALEKNDYVDLAVYPAAFVNRHAIELALKYLSPTLAYLLAQKPVVCKTHLILDNWNEVKCLLIALRADSSGIIGLDEIDFIDKVLNDFVEIDPSGEPFRYPEDKRGNLYLQDTAHVNLRVFGEAMSALAEIFERLFAALQELASFKAEGEQEGI